MLTFACPSCAQTLSAPDAQAGMTACCSKCGSALIIPGVPGAMTTLPELRPAHSFPRGSVAHGHALDEIHGIVPSPSSSIAQRLKGGVSNRRSIALIMAAAIGLLVVACAVAVLFWPAFRGLPTEADARDVFEHKMRDKINAGILRIKSFQKVNSVTSEVFGVEMHSIHYKAEIEYLKAGDVLRAGVILEITGEVEFKRTEKGWLAKNGKLY